MIDQQVIQSLESRDAETRKRAIKALAKSGDEAALPHLARVYREDSDTEVRELARKAGIYIRKQAAATEPAYQPSYSANSYTPPQPENRHKPSDTSSENDALLMPDVSERSANRAKTLIDQAMTWHTRGDNDKATQNIQKALAADPRLKRDSYTISLAASVMEMDGAEAIKQLSSDNTGARPRDAAPASEAATGLQRVFAGVFVVGAVLVLVGYLALPWVDLSSVPTGDGSTVGEGFAELRTEFDGENREQAVVFLGEDFVQAFENLKISFNGVDTTLISIGARNILDAIGITDLVAALGDVNFFGIGEQAAELDLESADLAYTPGLLDYTLPLVPVVSLIGVVLGLLLLVGGSLGRWAAGLVIGLVGLVPMLYFYLSTINDIVPENADAALLEFNATLDPASLIGTGFWVSLVGVLVLAIVPFLAMLLTPQTDNT